MSRTIDELIKDLNLNKHPEGGYFVETDRQEALIPSPFANNEPRSLATTIYYLLTPDHPSGLFHSNRSVIYHVLHQGRSEYTFITPGQNGSPPTVESKILGTNASAGETRLLVAPGNVWRRIRLLPEDVADPNSERARQGCLTTEVVVPGFHWEDHKFMTKKHLREIFEGVQGGSERVKEFEPFVKDE